MNIVKTHISNGYRWRLLLITLMMLGFGAFCVYDWQVRYPLKVQQYDTFNEIREQHPETYPQVWKDHAAQQGWSDKTPGRKTSTDVLTQLVMALITLPAGLFFLFKVIKEHARWVAVDEQGITASGGHTVPWDSIQSLDETRWKSKGIAWLHYTDSSGSEHKILLDDFKQEPEAVKYIVAAVQNVLNPEAANEEAQASEDTDPPTEEADPAVG